MDFKVLSHAGLLVRAADKTLIFDPWLIGSAYWRSWWNYPPVSKQLVNGLKPDFIYLTHIHWDHFHGPSLRKFSKETLILIPRSDSLRIKRDLHQIGFKNVVEMRHGKRLELAPNFFLTSYQFYPFTDSAAVVECEDRVLLNANDAKFMGGPLRQILRRHPKVDFVFRSHSSANPRICFDIIDAIPGLETDNQESYIRDFVAFAQYVGARYAIPFASNHCFLHKEVFHLNHTVTTPMQVENYFKSHGITYPEVKVMVSGDSWSSEDGFITNSGSYFTQRESHLLEYAEAQTEKLHKFYALEEKTQVTLAQVQGYFRKFISAIPFPIRFLFKDRKVTYVLTGKGVFRFQVDLYRGVVLQVEEENDLDHPLQIHTSAYIFGQCMAVGLFLHLGISKRVRFRARARDMKYLKLLELLFNMYESEMLPSKKMLSLRFISVWIPRWREVILYARIFIGKLLGRPFVLEHYLRK